MDANPDTAIDLLYAAPPSEFVQRRNELARSLRAEGQSEAAAEVKGLRRPTTVAWALNRLSREERMRLRGLFTAGERLRQAHAALLAGGPPEALQEARDDERRAIDELARAARALLEQAGQPASEATLDGVRQTLHAAVVDEAVAERLRAGRLEREERATGFAADAFAAPARRKTTAKRAGKPQKAHTAEKEEKRRAEERAREERRQAQTAARDTRRRAQSLVREERLAVKEAERAVAAQARGLELAERELGRRRAALEAAERALHRANAPRGAT